MKAEGMPTCRDGSIDVPDAFEANAAIHRQGRLMLSGRGRHLRVLCRLMLAKTNYSPNGLPVNPEWGKRQLLRICQFLTNRAVLYSALLQLGTMLLYAREILREILRCRKDETEPAGKAQTRPLSPVGNGCARNFFMAKKVNGLRFYRLPVKLSPARVTLFLHTQPPSLPCISLCV